MPDHESTDSQQPESNLIRREPTVEELRQWILLGEIIRVNRQLGRRPLQGVLDQKLLDPVLPVLLDQELPVSLHIRGASVPAHLWDYFYGPDQTADKAEAQTVDDKPSQALPAEPTEVRPDEPTAGYCLIPPRKVRWAGEVKEVKLQSRLYHLLAFVLRRHKKGSPQPISCQVIEEHLDRNSNQNGGSHYVAKAASDLNKRLVPIAFPWIFRTEAGFLLDD
jgi:hypothetical protein